MADVKVKNKSIKKSVSKAFISFERYITLVLKQIHPESSITGMALEQLNSIVNYIGESLVAKAVSLTTQGNSDAKTVTEKEIEYAVRLVLPGELAKHAVTEGTKAVYIFRGSVDINQGRSKVSRSERARILFSPARAEKFFSKYDKRIGLGTPIYLAVVLEYITAEILELSGNASRDDKKVKIKTRHIFMSVANDPELSKLFSDLKISIPGSGVVPYIDARLLPTREDRQKKISRKQKKGKHGTVALRDIQTKQKQSDCVYFGKLPFQRFVRELAQEWSMDAKFSENAMIILQLYIENYLVELLEKANQLALHSGRVLINGKDLMLVRRIMGDV